MLSSVWLLLIMFILLGGMFAWLEVVPMVFACGVVAAVCLFSLIALAE